MKYGLHYLLLVCAVSAPRLVTAADHVNLEEGLPTQLEDARPIAYGGREIQLAVGYERGDEENTFILNPRYEIGLLPNTQVSVDVPFRFGEGDKHESGNLEFEAMYALWQEGVWLPAVALAGFVEAPTGLHATGFDPGAKLLITKMPWVRTHWLHELHLNLQALRNTARADGENEYRFRGVVGASFRLGPDGIGIVNFLREQERLEGEVANLVEAGYRMQLTPFTVLSIGAQAGVNNDAYDFGATLGWQMAF